MTGVTWSNDSRFILTWSQDLTLKLISLHKLPEFLPFTFSGNKREIIRAFFSEDNKRIFSVSQNGTLLLWKWTSDRSKESDAVIKFEEFKMGKRLKTGPKPNQYVVVPADTDLFSPFEQELAHGKGRFLLEKKSKFQMQSDSRVVSCDIS